MMHQPVDRMALALPLADAHLQRVEGQSVVIDLDACQPVIIRENRSKQNAT